MRQFWAGFIVFTLGTLASSGALASSQPTQADALTLCQVAANPSKYSGKVVRVTAIYMTDMLERSLLIDPSCKTVRINLYDGPTGPYQASIDELNSAEFKVHREQKPVIFKLNFSAVFRTKRMPHELPFSKREQGRLHLVRVWSYSWLPRVLQKQ